MRLTFDVKGLDEATREIAERFSERRLQSVGVIAATRTARDIEAAWSGQLRARFDRPTSATERAVFVERATPGKPAATVGIKDRASGTPPVDWLGPEERGGARGLKKFEQALASTGAIPRGAFVVPGPAAKLDAYGNVGRGQIIQVIAQLGAQFSPGYQRVISKSASKRAQTALLRGRAYVAIPKQRGELRAGIYERKGTGKDARLVAVFYVVSRATYRPRTDLMQTAQRVAQAVMPGHVGRAFAESAARLAQRG